MEHENVSYEEEQLQIIIMNELKNKTLEKERELRQLQDIEYQESLDKDLAKLSETFTEDKAFKEISLEEMRQIRIQRFSK